VQRIAELVSQNPENTYAIYCDIETARIMNIVECGFTSVCALGFMYFVSTNWTGFVQVTIMSVWVTRLYMLAGFFLSVYQLYKLARGATRVVNEWLGETILEPHAHAPATTTNTTAKNNTSVSLMQPAGTISRYDDDCYCEVTCVKVSMSNRDVDDSKSSDSADIYNVDHIEDIDVDDDEETTDLISLSITLCFDAQGPHDASKSQLVVSPTSTFTSSSLITYSCCEDNRKAGEITFILDKTSKSKLSQYNFQFQFGETGYSQTPIQLPELE